MVHHVQDPELLFEMMTYATFTLSDDISNSTRDGMQNAYN